MAPHHLFVMLISVAMPRYDNHQWRNLLKGGVGVVNWYKQVRIPCSRHKVPSGGGTGRGCWKENGNQIMLRCLLKHTKIHILWGYFVYKYLQNTFLTTKLQTRYKRCSQRKRRVANWFDNCCHWFVDKVYPINVTQAHWHHTMECWCTSFRTVLVLEQLTKWYLSEYLITFIVWPRYEVKMRSRLHLKTACTTTMPP